MLSRTCAAIGVVLLVSSTVAVAQTQLAWSDEFNGTSLDTTTWEPMIGDGTAYGISGWGNNELQWYTSRPENVSVSGGNLHITARRDFWQGHQFTSARLRTLNSQSFLYGRFEGRIKVPAGDGLWPAFWMLPTGSPYGGWASSGEIDIMETVNAADRVHGTIHFGDQWPGNASNGGTRSMNLSNDFHIYAIDWEPDRIRWYVDGVLYHTALSNDWYSTIGASNDRAPFDINFHLLLNLAVGGNWPGNPSASTPFPAELLVDWVRVYETVQNSFVGVPHPIPGRIQAEDYDTGNPGQAYNDCDTTNNGGAYRPNGGVDIEASTEGGFNIGWMCPGEWIEYTANVSESGLYRMSARVASQATGGAFHIESDGVDVSGPMTFASTGGWQTWTTVQADITLGAGVQVIRFVNDSTGSQEYNFNYLDFELLDTCACDWNNNSSLDSDDFFNFLTEFFAGLADFNGSVRGSDDFFSFLDCFFNPGPGC